MSKTTKLDEYIKRYTEKPKDKAEFERGKVRMMTAYRFMKAREAAGLTQRDLATAARVPQRTVARVELGDNTSIDTLSKLAVALGKTLEVSLA